MDSASTLTLTWTIKKTFKFKVTWLIKVVSLKSEPNECRAGKHKNQSAWDDLKIWHLLIN